MSDKMLLIADLCFQNSKKDSSIINEYEMIFCFLTLKLIKQKLPATEEKTFT